jgi:hypothetical protein
MMMMMMTMMIMMMTIIILISDDDKNYDNLYTLLITVIILHSFKWNIIRNKGEGFNSCEAG